MVTKVFLSSTSRDLEAYRKLACEVCLRLGMLPLPMEFFEAMGVGATAGSRLKLGEADLYVGIFAHRYGHVEPAEGRSVTECEFEHAGTLGLDRLCFLAEPGFAVEQQPQGRALQARQRAFRARIESHLIRALFTTPDDFGLKLAQALTAWEKGDAQARWPQPWLESRVLTAAADPAERWSFRAQAVPLLGRDAEMADLLRWCSADAAVSWQVLAGSAGTGKSRLAQALCLALPSGWRAGFVSPDQAFDWSNWQPNASTLLVLDYAAEHLNVARAVLGALVRLRTAERRPVRLLLLERDAEGPWLQDLLGSRSDAAEFRRLRAGPRAVVLGPLADDAVWALTKAAGDAEPLRLPPREQWLAYVDRLDPQRTPLLIHLAIEHWRRTASLQDAGRDALLSAWMTRERSVWQARGASSAYENLLALATACGGLPDSVLAQAADPAWPLPPDLEFDPAVYAAMGVRESLSDRLAPLRPDLLGEWMVLESLRGRNARLGERRAGAFSRLAWLIVGGETRRALVPGLAGAWWVTPSAWVHFLRRCIDDFADHESLLTLLAPPPPQAEGRDWWLRVVCHAVERLAAQGRVEAVQRLLTHLEQAQGLAEADDWLLRARIVLAAALARDGQADAAASLIERMSAAHQADPRSDAHAARAAEAAMATLDLAAQAPLASALLAMLALAVQRSPSQDSLPAYARGLAQWVENGSLPIESRLAQFHALQTLCTQHVERDVTPLVSLSRAASVLCDHYLDQEDQLDQAMHMSGIVRAVLRQRERWQVVDPDEDRAPLSGKVRTHDLREMRLHLARCAIGLVPMLRRAQRHRDANERLVEIQHLARPYGWDADFVRCWAAAVVMDAQELAAQGETQPVLKAIDAILPLAQRLTDEAGAFIELVTQLGQSQVRLAAKAADAERCVELLDRIAQANAMAGAGPASERHLAGAATVILCTPGLLQTLAAQKHVLAAAASAIRSGRLREYAVEQGWAETQLDAVLGHFASIEDATE